MDGWIGAAGAFADSMHNRLFPVARAHVDERVPRGEKEIVVDIKKKTFKFQFMFFFWFWFHAIF